jgi:hypothetical protein
VIDPIARIGAVHLSIADLHRSVRFDETRLGFVVHRHDDRTAWARRHRQRPRSACRFT